MKIDHAEGFENRQTCQHSWQPLSFVFETELSMIRPREPTSPLNMLDPGGLAQPRLDVVPQVRQPDLEQGRVYCVCMKCASHTYVVTPFIGFYLGGDRPVEPMEDGNVKNG